MSGILCAIVYFILRPKDEDKFRVWWKQARFGILLLIGSLWTSGIFTVIYILYYLIWLTVPADVLCEQVWAVQIGNNYSMIAQPTNAITFSILGLALAMILMIFLMA